MAKRQRVDWSDWEAMQYRTSMKEALQQRKVKLPIDTPRGRTTFFKVSKEIMAILKNAHGNFRPRNIVSIENITGDLRRWFIDNGVFYPDLRAMKRYEKERPTVGAAPDPKDERIAELQLEVEAQKQTVVDLLNDLKTAKAEVAELRAKPDAFTVVQRWVAQTLAMALSQADAEKKGWTSVPPQPKEPIRPEDSILERYTKEPIPDFERARRKDPTPTQGTGDLRPKFAIVADFVGVDKHTIHQGVSDIANPRYLDSGSKLDGMKAFHSNGGRVVVWATHAPHDWEAKLQGMGVTFKRFHGSTQALIDHIRHEAVKK